MYCLPNLIIYNESVPLGVSVGPTESHLVYQQFYDFIHSINEKAHTKLSQLPVLSDEGSSLVNFCRSNSLNQFFCYRHLINKFGASSKLGGIVRGLLFSATREEFQQNWTENERFICEELSQTSDLHVAQFERLFGA